MAITPRLLLGALALASFACGGTPTSPTASTTSAATVQKTTFTFTSDPQDFVAKGQSGTFTLQNAVFQPNVGRSGGYLSVVVRPNNDPSSLVGLVVTAPTGRRLAAGTYETNRFETASTAGLDFFVSGACSASSGRLVIHDVAFGTNLDTLQHFRATFEQRCQGTLAASRGEVAVLADPWR